MSGRVVKSSQRFKPVARLRPKQTEDKEEADKRTESATIQPGSKRTTEEHSTSQSTTSDLQENTAGDSRSSVYDVQLAEINPTTQDHPKSQAQAAAHLPLVTLVSAQTTVSEELPQIQSPSIAEGSTLNASLPNQISNPPAPAITNQSGHPSSVAKAGDDISSRSRKRKRRTSPPMPGAETGSGDPLDPTTVTMRDLCGETSFGRVSSRHVEVQEAHIRARKAERERRAQIAKIREAKEKRGEDLDNPDVPLDLPPAVQLLASTLETTANQEEFDYAENLKASHYTVAMRMDASGQMVLDEESLLVDRGADPSLMQDEAAMEHVEETDITHFVNSASHSRKLRGSRWTREETALFYEALQQYNTDFAMISLIMPGRSARECRNKFNSEDKKNPDRIDWALKNPVPINLDLLAQMTGKTFSGPLPPLDLPTNRTAPLEESSKAPHVAGCSTEATDNTMSSRTRNSVQLNTSQEEEIVCLIDNDNWNG